MIPYSSMTSPFPNEDPQSLAKSILFEVVLSDSPELINEFLDENVGFDINCTINLNQTALMFAAKFNYYNAARTLIERGAEIKSPSQIQLSRNFSLQKSDLRFL